MTGQVDMDCKLQVLSENEFFSGEYAFCSGVLDGFRNCLTYKFFGLPCHDSLAPSFASKTISCLPVSELIVLFVPTRCFIGHVTLTSCGIPHWQHPALETVPARRYGCSNIGMNGNPCASNDGEEVVSDDSPFGPLIEAS